MSTSSASASPTSRGPRPVDSGGLALRALAGGGPANTAVALARLGTPTRFLGRLSDDAFGTLFRARLSASGVDLTGSVTSSEPSTLAVADLDATGRPPTPPTPTAPPLAVDRQRTRRDAQRRHGLPAHRLPRADPPARRRPPSRNTSLRCASTPPYPSTPTSALCSYRPPPTANGCTGSYAADVLRLAKTTVPSWLQCRPRRGLRHLARRRRASRRHHPRRARRPRVPRRCARHRHSPSCGGCRHRRRRRLLHCGPSPLPCRPRALGRPTRRTDPRRRR
ncbi:hypothetical protein SGLAM104S_08289 [Streptomyces glaucescens]